MSKRAPKVGKGSADPSGSANNGAVAAAAPSVVAPSPDSAMEKAKASVLHWAERVQASVRAMEHVQAMLRLLAARNDKDQRELQRLRIEAGFLAALKLEELKAHREAAAAAAAAGEEEGGGGRNIHSSGGQSGRGKRGGSAGRGRKSVGEGAAGSSPRTSMQGEGSAAPSNAAEQDAQRQQSLTEASPTALERKRQRLHQTIMAVYYSHPPALAAAPPSASSMTPKAAGAQRPLGTRTPSPQQQQQQQQQRATMEKRPSSPAHMPAGGAAAGGQAAPHGYPSAISNDGEHSPTMYSATRLPVSSPLSQRRGGSANTTASTATATVAAGGTSITSLAAAITGDDVRRPKDVPPPVWDELLILRGRRIAVEAHVNQTNAVVVEQMEKLPLLQEQVMVARYGLQSAFDLFVKRGGLKEEVAEVDGVAWASGTGPRPGSRSTSGKAYGSSASGAAATAGRASAR